MSIFYMQFILLLENLRYIDCKPMTQGIYSAQLLPIMYFNQDENIEKLLFYIHSLSILTKK